MGNCIVMKKKVIKIMRNDGEVIEYKGPMKVHDILTQFSAGHYSVYDSTSSNCHLHPQAKLLCGRLYYLVPKQTTTVKHKEMKSQKKVRFANPLTKEEEEGDRLTNCGDNTKVKTLRVRVKMVVTKKELEKLLQGGSVREMVYRSLAKQHLCHDDDDDADECLRGWRPLLHSISESV